MVWKQIKIAFILLIVLTLITGLLYPFAITGLAEIFFPWRANGSLIKIGDKKIGSEWIGQFFSTPGYFQGRPSATPDFPYNPLASKGSNQGPSNPVFLLAVNDRVNQLKLENSQANELIPIDLITASGSGLDPEISPSAAFYQVARIAKVRSISEQAIYALIKSHIKPRTLGILGEPRVNVLQLNLALDQLRIQHARTEKHT